MKPTTHEEVRKYWRDTRKKQDENKERLYEQKKYYSKMNVDFIEFKIRKLENELNYLKKLKKNLVGKSKIKKKK